MMRVKVVNERQAGAEAPGSRALEYMQNQLASGKWIFVNGMLQIKPVVNEQTGEIVITMKLMGG